MEKVLKVHSKPSHCSLAMQTWTLSLPNTWLCDNHLLDHLPLSTSTTPVTRGLQRLSRRIPELEATHRSVSDPPGNVHRSRILNSRPTVPLRTGQHVDPFAIEPRTRGSPRSASTLAKAV